MLTDDLRVSSYLVQNNSIFIEIQCYQNVKYECQHTLRMENIIFKYFLFES